MAPSPVRLLGLSGSLRRGANSTAILDTLARSLPPGVRLTRHDLAAVPLYNQDEDGERAPEPVRALRAAIAAADGLVIASPEYNYGMPGLLKNALDWVSRPAYRSSLRDKPALVITSSPGFLGGVRAQAQIRETLFATLARPVPGPEIVIASAGEKVKDGRLVDEAALRFALEGIDRLVAEIRHLRRRDEVPAAA